MSKRGRRHGHFRGLDSGSRKGSVATTAGVCRVCGCTHDNACYHEGLGTCWWAEPDLCSHCKAIADGDIFRSEVEQPADRAVFNE